jgi:type II restriction enzyme
MKFHDVYQEMLGCKNSKDVFKKFIDTLTDSILVWDYFVNWSKVFDNIKNFEIALNTLNYLVGKSDIKSELVTLIKKDPEITKVIPVLLACRGKVFKVNETDKSGNLISKVFDFKKLPKSTDEINRIVEFADKAGLLKIIMDKKIKSIPDYVIGVEVGLDTNGRKNRSGKNMENIVYGLLNVICQENKYEILSQANRSKISAKWGIELETLESDKYFDFAVKTPTKLHIIETNYYSGGGSKLKSTAGEYISYHKTLLSQGINFIWVTDGKGWAKTQKPLKDTYKNNDYILNLEFIKAGILEAILTSE